MLICSFTTAFYREVLSRRPEMNSGSITPILTLPLNLILITHLPFILLMVFCTIPLPRDVHLKSITNSLTKFPTDQSSTLAKL